MWNLLKNVITLIIVIVKLCTSTSENSTFKSLAVICSVRNFTKVANPPEQCTAMLAIASDMDQVDGANKMRDKLPLLIIMDTLDYMSDRELLQKDPAEVLKDFKNVSFDCMAIKYIYEFNSTSQEIGSFLDKTKEAFPGKGFGLVLNRFMKHMVFRLNLTELQDHADFFLLETTIYRICAHHDHQADMEIKATKDDILETLNILRDNHQPLDKMIFTIELKIDSQMPLSSEDMDFSYLCSHTLSVKRKYCFNSIQTLFEKARLRITEGLAGIHVLGIDDDDYSGTCGCTTQSDSNATFRGLKTIAGASTENNNDINYYQCTKGEYPVIKKK